ncbi:hypothetical protein BDW74DRAFT_187876 [Aspergillus multicolor]|uniref:N-acyl homoserine lactonase family protein n=1 Tax=Aspergillus multicolor TaxID=41759 RepID=UPI003CCCCD69
MSDKPPITFLSTGTVRIRQQMRSQPVGSHMLVRRFRSLLDWTWIEPLPIGVFLIDHPDGPILFDTGQSPRCNEPGYFSRWNFVANSLARYTVAENESVLSLLRTHGVQSESLQMIVLSHLHSDHAGGLQELHAAAPNVPIYISPAQWEVFGKNPLYAILEGCLPEHWPQNFAPKILESKDHAVGPWTHCYPLTADAKIVAVDTPGHVPGHISLVVHEDGENDANVTYFLTGDAVYGLDLLDKEEPDGINSDPEAALRSLKLIKEFATQSDVVVAPSHDVNTPQILAERRAYKPN